jgi:predicted HTH transcriptional regulator
MTKVIVRNNFMINDVINDVINEVTNDVINESEKIVLNLIFENNKITKTLIVEKSGMSGSKVDRIIASLRKKGRLTRVGSNKNGHWKIKNNS